MAAVNNSKRLPWVLLALLLTLSPACANDLGNTTWSETDASNTSTPPNGWPTGMLPNQVEPAARQIMGALKRFYDWASGTQTSTGSAGAYALTYSVAPAAYVQGQQFTFKANFTSVGADTLNVNALGALAIYEPSSSGPIKINAGDIQSGQMVTMSYDSALNSSAGGFHLLGGQTISGIPSGSLMPYAGSTAPNGWLLAYGQCVSTTTYPALYAAIGTTWSTTDSCTTGNFGLPDMRGRVVAGMDPSNATGRLTSPISAAALGNAGGVQDETIAVANLPNYDLSVSGSVTTSLPQNNSYGTVLDPFVAQGGGSGIGSETYPATVSLTVNSGGSGTALPTVQPTIVLNYIIKT